MDITKIRNYLFLLGIITVTILFFYVITPLFYPLFWAAVIASITYPIYRGLAHKLKHENLSAFITIILVLLVIILPLTIVATLLVRESIGIISSVNDNQGQIKNFLESINNFVINNQTLARLHIDNSMIAQRINDLSVGLFNFIYQSAKAFTQNSLRFFALFVLMIYALFFFLRDGKKFLTTILHMIPLSDRYEKMLYEKFTSTTGATIKGTLLVGGLQGALSGFLFAATGVPSPIILGLLTTFFAIIPAAGSFVVWFPVGVIMIAIGNTVKGIIILVVGALFIGVIDNLVRPLLVGKDIQMHPVVVLFTTLGGLVIFGISGFVIGPVIAAIFQSFWGIYEQYYHKELIKD